MPTDTQMPPGPDARSASYGSWKSHLAVAGTHRFEEDQAPEKAEDQRRRIEPWLSALCQAEHLGLLVGNGLTSAVASLAGSRAANMSTMAFSSAHAQAVHKAAEESAGATGRGEPNFEDQIRAALEFIHGLRILARTDEGQAAVVDAWESELNGKLNGLLKAVLEAEQQLEGALGLADEKGKQLRRYLGSFLLSFASRTATRERLHIFTTNYDRLIEYGCDALGLRVLDRFVGRLKPVFRSSRLGVDMHYNPPGIRGEPNRLFAAVREFVHAAEPGFSDGKQRLCPPTFWRCKHWVGRFTGHSLVS